MRIRGCKSTSGGVSILPGTDVSPSYEYPRQDGPTGGWRVGGWPGSLELSPAWNLVMDKWKGVISNGGGGRGGST